MYNLPDINLLSKSLNFNEAEEMERAAREGDLIAEKTTELGARLNIEDITIGPQVISFSAIPAEGVLARQLPRLAADLQLELGCESISIHAPSPGTKFVKIEIPNVNRRMIHLGDVL